jgi:hypothetical protein
MHCHAGATVVMPESSSKSASHPLSYGYFKPTVKQKYQLSKVWQIKLSVSRDALTDPRAHPEQGRRQQITLSMGKQSRSCIELEPKCTIVGQT